MTLSRSNRRTTDRISKTTDESASPARSSSRRSTVPSQRKPVESEEKAKANGSISKRAPAASSQRKPAESSTTSKPAVSGSTKRSPAPLSTSKVSPIDAEKKASAAIPTKSSVSSAAPKTSERKSEKELPASSISKRQPIIPATEGKKTSTRIPITESTKGSTKIPIKPSTPAPSSMETTITKAPGSLSSRKILSNTNAQPEEAVKNPSKRSRASASQKSGRSGKVSPKKGSLASNNNVIYGVLGAILLVLIILIITKVSGGNQPQKVIVKSNNLDNGIALCQKARDLYRSDRERSPEALEYLKQGIAMMNSALDPMRDASNNLPANMRGHEGTLAEWNAFKKTLSEEAFQANARKERKMK